MELYVSAYLDGETLVYLVYLSKMMKSKYSLSTNTFDNSSLSLLSYNSWSTDFM